MSMRIGDALDIPAFSDLSEFIARINDTEERVKNNLRTFVVPANLEKKLDHMLAAVGHNLDQGRDIGRYIYGTFGSGKSHLMTVLAKMLERDETVYALGDEALARLRAGHPWIDQHRTLVVRLNMMNKRSLAEGLFEAYNDSLPEGVPPVELTDEDTVFELFDKDAARFGGEAGLVDRMVAEGVIPSAQFFAKQRQGSKKQRMGLAAQIETWRNHGEKTVRPEELWVDAEEGFARIARHAKENGFTAISWMIDELVIWIRGKRADQYVEQINQLSALVDHDSDRVVPFFVAVAVQQDVSETCPEDLSEKGFREQLGFIANRFQPRLDLEDQDLFEVTARRVLKPKDEAKDAWRAEVKKTLGKHGQALRTLTGDIPPDQIEALYPFHPALMRILVDCTQGLSRSRSAMSALYGLLKAQADLEVGHFIPVGALYDVLFTKDMVEDARGRTGSVHAQRLADAADSYERLKLKLDQASEAKRADPKELHQLFKTVLLCQLSEKDYFGTQRLADRTKASFILHLNQSDIQSRHPRLGQSKVVGLFNAIDSTEIRVDPPKDPDPFIKVQTDRVDSDQVLRAASAELTPADLFAYTRSVVDAQLGLQLGSSTKTKLDVSWRGTKRRGRVEFCNVRTLSYAGKTNEFAPADDEAFLILVDYPFDEDPTKTRQDDIDTLSKARERGRQWTVAWLPDHFNAAERSALEKAAAINRVRRDPNRFLESYAPKEAERIRRALETHQTQQRSLVEDAVRRAYMEAGEIHACSELLDGVSHEGKDRTRVPAGLASDILDARYPNHPHFGRRVTAKDLQYFAEYVVKAAVTGQPVETNSTLDDLVKAYGLPLEMVYGGQGNFTRRPDGRYLARIHEALRGQARVKARVLEDLLTGDGKEGFGFTSEVVKFFFFYLLLAEGYEAIGRTSSLTIQEFKDIPSDFELVEGDVVEHAVWDRALEAERALFEPPSPGKKKGKGRADIPSVPEQAKLAREVVDKAGAAREQVTTLKVALQTVLQWAEVDDSAKKRGVAALEETLVELTANKTAADRVRALAKVAERGELAELKAVMHGLAAEQAALDALKHQATMFRVVRDSGTEDEKKAVVVALQNRLKAPVASPLHGFVTGWSETAQRIGAEVIERLRPPTPPNPDDPDRRKNVEVAPGQTSVARSAAGVARPEAEARLKALLEEALAELGDGPVDLELTVKGPKKD